MRPILLGDETGIGRAGRWSAVAALAAVLILPGCGAVVEKALEEAAEEVTGIEVDTDVDTEEGTISFDRDGVSVSIDTAGDSVGSVSIESSEGTVQIDADSEEGTVNVSSEGFDGGEDRDASFAVDVDLPDDFPVPIPDGGDVESVSTFASGDSALTHVGVAFSSSRTDELVAFYDDYFEAGVGRGEIARHELSGPQATVGFVANPDGRTTAVTIVTQGDETRVFIESTVEA